MFSLADMKDDEEFHLALSAKGWYENNNYPLSQKEKNYLHSYTKKHVFAVAGRYLKPYKYEIDSEIIKLEKEWPRRHTWKVRLSKTDCLKIAEYHHTGFIWKEIERVTHHNKYTIQSAARQYGVRV